MNDAQLVRGVQSTRRLLENFRNLRHGKRATPREGLTERFAFEILHGDIGRAVIGLAGFVNGDDIRVMNAPRGSSFTLKAQQKFRVIQQLAAQDLERYGTFADCDLLSEEDRKVEPPSHQDTKQELDRRSPLARIVNRELATRCSAFLVSWWWKETMI